MWKDILKSELVQQGGVSGLFLPEKLNVPNRRDCCEEARVKLNEKDLGTFDAHGCEELYHILWYAVEVDSEITFKDPYHKVWLLELKEEWDRCDGGKASKHHDTILARQQEQLIEYPF